MKAKRSKPRQPGLSRRGLLGGLAVGSRASAKAAGKPPGSSTGQPLLVNIFLRGGCDMLGPLMPFKNMEYQAGLRTFTRGLEPTPLHLPNEVVELKDDNGNTIRFPMAPAGDLWGVPKTCLRVATNSGLFAGGVLTPWNAGHFAYVLGAGSLLDDLSHFTKMCEMETASVPGCPHFDGWIARTLNLTDTMVGTPSVRGVAISGRRPKSFLGGEDVIVAKDLPTYALDGPQSPPNSTTYELVISGNYAQTAEPLKTAAAATFDGFDWAADTYSLPYTVMGGADYEEQSSNLGKSLLDIAKASSNSPAGTCPNIFHLDVGGFDTHSDENIFETGDDALGRIYRDLFKSLEAFYLDMMAHGQNFVVMLMSEFGRRAQENDSEGTDHGAGGLMMLMGPSVKGRKIYGNWSSSIGASLVNGNFPVSVDYRNVVAEVLVEHLGLDEIADLPVVFGPGCLNYQPLGIL